jgi:hypothetical protein
MHLNEPDYVILSLVDSYRATHQRTRFESLARNIILYLAVNLYGIGPYFNHLREIMKFKMHFSKIGWNRLTPCE